MRSSTAALQCAGEVRQARLAAAEGGAGAQGVHATCYGVVRLCVVWPGGDKAHNLNGGVGARCGSRPSAGTIAPAGGSNHPKPHTYAPPVSGLGCVEFAASASAQACKPMQATASHCNFCNHQCNDVG
jgi:hypothetical protein